MTDPMRELIREFRLIPPGSTVLCAVSGGADSVCLLHRLWRLRRELGFQLAAAHFDHRLRGEESAQDLEFVREFVSLCCGRERYLRPDGGGETLPPVELYTGSGDVAAQARASRRGVEETAREMRYAFLRETARQAGAQYIATAHTANDNGETILLHLARGTGLRGLCGIAPQSGDLIRPLLTTTREEVEGYLRFWGLPWREDPSNREDVYARNRVRHQVLPRLEELYPGVLVRLTDTARRLREDEAYLTAQAAGALDALEEREDGSLVLPAEALSGLPQPLAVRAARLLLARAGGGDDRCAAPHLEALAELSRSRDPSARLDLPGGLTARREYERLILTRQAAPPPLSHVELALPGLTRAGEWEIACTLERYWGQPQGPLDFCLDRGRVPALTARPRRTGDRLTLPGRPGKTVKKWMIDLKIPRGDRDRLPVLDCAGQAAGAAGLGPDAAFLPEMGAEVWHIRLVHPKFGEKTEKRPVPTGNL